MSETDDVYAGLASRAWTGQSQGTAAVPVLGSLARPQPENHVGSVALLCTGDHTGPAASRSTLVVSTQVSQSLLPAA